MCGNPKLAIAGTACCMAPNNIGVYYGFDRCEYHLEKVTWDKAVSRCAGIIDDTTESVPLNAGALDMGRFWSWLTGTGDQANPQHTMEPCKKRTGFSRAGIRALDGCGYNYRASWINEPCSMQVQVDRFGRLSAVHVGATEKAVQLDSGNMFHVHWKGGVFPLAADGCAGGSGGTSCTVHGLTCLCSIFVADQPVFAATGTAPTVKEVRSKLKIGSPAVIAFASSAYARCTSSACNAVVGVEIYLKAGGSAPSWDADTIFKTANPTAFFFNRLSTVHIGASADATAFSFRNAPHFISLTESSTTDMEAEIEAILDMLATHDNTAPFVSRRLIQHLVTSNPSPRYIKAVSTAFRTGNYDGIGSGEYGDLGATVAAVMLDREARNGVMDAAPSFGKVHEPHLKVMHLLRSMEFISGGNGQKEVVLQRMATSIGMQPYSSPSVFNFYANDFTPQGPLGRAGLYSPEMMLGTAPFLLGFINGASSLISSGLSKPNDANNRFGFGPTDAGIGLSRRDSDGSLKGNGYLSFAPRSTLTDATAVVGELGLLLASGRLDAHSRSVIETAYETRLTVPPAAVMPTGVELKLHATNYGCSEGATSYGSRFRLTLQATKVGKSGGSGMHYLRNARNDGKELHVPGIVHWAWPSGDVGTWLFIKASGKTAGDPLFYDCATLAGMFNPGDLVLVSQKSRASLPAAALQLAQTLIVASAEFNTANVNARAADKPRQDPLKVVSQDRKYKAIVVVFLWGGVDSWNILIPSSGCTATTTTTAADGKTTTATAAFDLYVGRTYRSPPLHPFDLHHTS